MSSSLSLYLSELHINSFTDQPVCEAGLDFTLPSIDSRFEDLTAAVIHDEHNQKLEANCLSIPSFDLRSPHHSSNILSMASEVLRVHRDN